MLIKLKEASSICLFKRFLLRMLNSLIVIRRCRSRKTKGDYKDNQNILSSRASRIVRISRLLPTRRKQSWWYLGGRSAWTTSRPIAMAIATMWTRRNLCISTSISKEKSKICTLWVDLWKNSFKSTTRQRRYLLAGWSKAVTCPGLVAARKSLSTTMEAQPATMPK